MFDCAKFGRSAVIRVDEYFSFIIGVGKIEIEAECKAVFSRRVSEQEYRVGLLIHSLPRASRIALDAYVDEYL